MVALRRHLALCNLCAQDLSIGHHDAVAHAHLVRMGAGRHGNGGELLGTLRIRHVHHQRAMRIVHVADVGDALVDDHLPAAGAIKPRHRLQTGALCGAVGPDATAVSDIHVGNFLDSFCSGHVSPVPSAGHYGTLSRPRNQGFTHRGL